jgi:epoxyqueuosine reductase
VGGARAVTASAAPVKTLEESIRAQAYGLGFDLAGITTLGSVETAPHFDQWLERGYAGDMHYLPKWAHKRRDSRLPYEGMRSAIVVAMNYGGAEPAGPVARYARGDDYHDVLDAKLRELHRWIGAELGRDVRGRACSRPTSRLRAITVARARGASMRAPRTR